MNVLDVTSIPILEFLGFAAAQPNTGLWWLTLWAQCSPKLGTVTPPSLLAQPHSVPCSYGSCGDVWLWSINFLAKHSWDTVSQSREIVMLLHRSKGKTVCSDSSKKACSLAAVFIIPCPSNIQFIRHSSPSLSSPSSTTVFYKSCK